MNVNIESIKIEKSGENNVRLAIMSKSNGYDEYPTFFVFSHAEYELMLACSKGKSKVYPYFDDGLYLIKITPLCIKVVYTNENKNSNTHYFYFPTLPVIGQMEYLFNGENDTIEFDKFTVDNWREHYAPKYQYNDILRYGSNDNPLESARVACPDMLERLEQIAKNYSDGNMITISLSFDGYNPSHNRPDDFYFDIRDDKNRRIMNGGIIWHGESYSMHT